MSVANVELHLSVDTRQLDEGVRRYLDAVRTMRRAHALAPQVRRLDATLRLAFKEQKRAIRRAIPRAIYTEADPETSLSKIAAGARIRRGVQQTGAAAIKAGARHVGYDLGVGVSLDVDDPRAVAYLAARGAELVTNLDETTRGRMRDLLKRAVVEGWNTDTLASAINADFSFSDARARMIARTELAAAHSQGALLAAMTLRDAGLEMHKRWLVNTPEDSPCVSNGEQGWIDLGDNFDSGHAAPPVHPNCECDVEYRATGKRAAIDTINADKVEVPLVPDIPDSAFAGQKAQFPEKGPPGISYVKGKVDARRYVNILLWRDADGVVVGILYHYPFNFGELEKKGNVNLLVDPAHRREGIGSGLLRAAMSRTQWDIDLTKQSYTRAGAAVANAVLSKPDVSAPTIVDLDATPEEIDSVLAMRRAGSSFPAIAKAHGRSSGPWAYNIVKKRAPELLGRITPTGNVRVVRRAAPPKITPAPPVPLRPSDHIVSRPERVITGPPQPEVAEWWKLDADQFQNIYPEFTPYGRFAMAEALKEHRDIMAAARDPLTNWIPLEQIPEHLRDIKVARTSALSINRATTPGRGVAAWVAALGSFDGKTVIRPVPAIVVNDKQKYFEIDPQYTVAHELGHQAIYRAGLLQRSSDAEVAANLYADKLLGRERSDDNLRRVLGYDPTPRPSGPQQWTSYGGKWVAVTDTARRMAERAWENKTLPATQRVTMREAAARAPIVFGLWACADGISVAAMKMEDA